MPERAGGGGGKMNINTVTLIIGSAFGLILLALGLALRFKIRQDEKNGIYNYNNKKHYNSRFCDDKHETDWSTINPATGFHRLIYGRYRRH
jgi:hypothetical protein